MRDRIITLAGGVLSFFIVIGLLTPPPSPYLEDISKPTSVDRGEFGLQGLKRWLEANAVPTFSLRRRYETLTTEPILAETGNLLITSLPHTLVPGQEELERLRIWLEQGNHALLLTAQNDRPEWAMLGAGPGAHRLLTALGYRLAADVEEPQQPPTEAKVGIVERIGQSLEASQRQAVTLAPTLRHGLLSGVESVITHTYPPLRETGWELRSTGGEPHSILTLLIDRETGNRALWQARIGSGGIWIASYPDLFGNVTLGAGDNARLLGNLIGRAVLSDGHVIFDDVHHGLTDLYDPKAFFEDSRLHHTLLFIGGFWLLYLLGRSPRLAPPRETELPPRTADFVAATGGLCARRLAPRSVAEGLLRHFFNEVRARHKMPQNGEPIWTPLEGYASISRRDLDALKRFHRALHHRRQPDLIRLTQILHRIRKALS